MAHGRGPKEGPEHVGGDVTPQAVGQKAGLYPAVGHGMVKGHKRGEHTKTRTSPRRKGGY